MTPLVTRTLATSLVSTNQDNCQVKYSSGNYLRTTQLTKYDGTYRLRPPPPVLSSEPSPKISKETGQLGRRHRHKQLHKNQDRAGRSIHVHCPAFRIIAQSCMQGFSDLHVEHHPCSLGVIFQRQVSHFEHISHTFLLLPPAESPQAQFLHLVEKLIVWEGK